MATQIKITQLTDIGSANLSVTTLLPVVNMAGVPTTQKTTLGNLANVILSQSGGNYAAVGTANIAYSVANAAQPNITSVGTLTNIVVSGNASINGNITSNGTAYVGNLSTTGLASITTLSVGATANLGDVSNVTITGGTAGQVLSTNGNGILSWASDATTYGNSNVVTLLSAFGSNTITTTGNVSVGNITATNLGNIVSANLDGNVSNLLTGNGTYVAIPVVPTVGNIATINLDGSNSNVLYGNGVFAPASGGGNANTGNVTFDDINVIGTGNLHLQPDPANAGAYLDIFLTAGPDIHIAGNGETVILGTDNFANVAVNVNGNVSIQAGDANGTHTWTFDTTGNLILAGGDSVIQSIANSSSEPLYPNVSTMVFTPDALLSSQSLVLDPTGPSHIHLRAPGANIDEPDANIFLGGEASSFEVGYYNGNVPNLYIHSNNNTWTFDTTGILVFPRDTGPNTTDPILTITGGASPKILSEDASLAGPANLEITALNTIFTGSSGSAIKIYPDDGEVASDGNLQIWANSGGNTEYSWTFDTTGNLTTPSNLVIGPGPGSGSSIFQYNEGLQILGEGANSVVQMGWTANTSAPDSVTTIAMNYPGGGEGNVLIAVGNNATTVNYWLFDNTGNLTLPDTTSVLANASITLEANDTGNITGLSLIGDFHANLYAHGNITLYANTGGAGSTWTFGANGNLVLPQGSIITNNIPPATFDILYQYDDLVWSGNTLTFTNASSTYMLGVLALMEVGDTIILDNASTTVTGVYTGGGAGTFTVSGTGVGQQIAQFTIPNRLTSVNGIKLTTNAKNYLFTEVGVTQSPVLTVDTLPSGQYAVAGFRAFVSDANLAPVGNFGAIVGNSGSNTVCVWCDGTNWRIG